MLKTFAFFKNCFGVLKVMGSVVQCCSKLWKNPTKWNRCKKFDKYVWNKILEKTRINVDT